jgi:hypothetical protein
MSPEGNSPLLLIFMGLSAHDRSANDCYTLPIRHENRCAREKTPMSYLKFTLKTLAVCTFVGAAIGAALYWNAGDGCMFPRPCLAILAGMVCGAGGFVAGLFLSAGKAVTDAVRQADDYFTHTAHSSENPALILLRSACRTVEAERTLLRPAAGVSEVKEEHLLRASSEEHLDSERALW